MKYFWTTGFIFLFFIPNLYSQSWKSVGGGANTGVAVIIADTINHVLYAGGGFDTIGGIAAKNIAKWDGNKWHPLGMGPGFPVTAIAVWNNNVYAGSLINNYVYKWNGLIWDTLPATDGYIKVLKVIKDTLYVGGGFNTASGTTVNSIAKWSGTKWLPIGNGNGVSITGCPGCAEVYDIDLYRDTLVIAGLFSKAGDSAVSNIAKWDGANWHTLGVGTTGSGQYDGVIENIFPHNNELYVVGTFTKAGTRQAKRIAVWDGNDWSNIGLGFDYEASTIEFFNNKLIVGGWYGHSGSKPIDGLAEWEDTAWVGFGGNVLPGNFVTSTIFKNELYTGGHFTATIKGQALRNIARWSQININASQTPLCQSNCNDTAMAFPVGLKPYTYKWSNTGQTTQTAVGLCPGNYTVSVTDSSGSVTTGSFAINFLPALTIKDTAINAGCGTCANGSAMVNISGGVPPYTYLWSTGDTISAITNQLPGTYTIMVKDSNGCILNDTLTIDFDNEVFQISDIRFQIYPNPVREQLIIKSTQLLNGELEVQDLTGRILKRQKLSASTTSTNLNISSLPTGIYLLRLKENNGWKVGKFVKE